MSSDHSSGADAARWDERYSGDDYHFGTEPNGFVVEAAALVAPGRALCIADGEGRNSVYLAQHGHEVTSMDASAVGMRKAERLAAERGVRITTRVADLRAFDFGAEEWDLIVSIFVHLPPEFRRDVHRRAVAALRPGGAFLLEAYTPEQLNYRTGGPSTPERLMRLEDLKVDLEGTDLEIARERVRHVAEGRGHDGHAAVVQVLARKPLR